MFTNNLLEVFLHLKNFNSTSYLVGGCVRDMLLNKKPKDFDIVTDCNLDLLTNILKDNGWKVDEAGKQFLVTIISKDGYNYEVCNFRKDGTYTDGRRPDSVEIGDIFSDSERRDLTINALYYDPFASVYLDPTKKGLDDIKNKIIRLNGNPNKRIEEDLLRIMRVYRFSNQLGFEIDKNTLKACRRNFNEMALKIPPERIKNEVEKMCKL